MKTRTIEVGGVKIGGGNPVTVQSMLTVPLTDTENVLRQISDLENAGCEIIRGAVPDQAAATALKEIIPKMKVPFVADIHFNYRLAIASAEAGAAKVRINPGNIGSDDNVRKVCECLRYHGIPARIGVNSGSVEKDILARYGGKVTAEGLAESAEKSVRAFEKYGLTDVAVSIKATDVPMTIEANRVFSASYDNPLHIGITEAGADEEGMIYSAVGIGSMLMEGIGDTIRVSLTGDPVNEVRVGREILRACGLRHEGVRVISCPTCARTDADTLSMVHIIKERTKDITTPMTVAVMGCVVNGPGESKQADIGVACTGSRGVIFRKGEIFKTVSRDEIVPLLLKEIFEIEKEKNAL